jgi:hypothetical protein
MSLVFISEFAFDSFNGGPQPTLLVRGEVLRPGLGINIKENDRVVLREIKVDDPSASCSAPALQSHPHLAQALQMRDHVAFLRVFQQVVLKLVKKMVIGDLRNKAVNSGSSMKVSSI